MRKDGTTFPDGSESPRRFSDAAAVRPKQAEADIDDAPFLPAVEWSPYATVGFADLKRGYR